MRERRSILSLVRTDQSLGPKQPCGRGDDVDSVAAPADRQGPAPQARGRHLLTCDNTAKDRGADRAPRRRPAELNAGVGSAARIERLIVLAVPASLDAGEITDKGYVNQRRVLARARRARRAALRRPATEPRHPHAGTTLS